MYIALVWWYREEELLLSALVYSTLSVQILYKLYSLQLNCTYSNCAVAAATCSAAQQHNTFTVQTVLCATELYLQ